MKTIQKRIMIKMLQEIEDSRTPSERSERVNEYNIFVQAVIESRRI